MKKIVESDRYGTDAGMHWTYKDKLASFDVKYLRPITLLMQPENRKM